MSFLVPSILWGLAAAAIPIIIHLLSIRKTQHIDFSTIRFIKELEHETIRKLKIRQWLLLFLRTLAIILLVLAFSRPVKVGYFPPWAAGDRNTKMVIILDNSASMSAIYDGESLLDRSKNNIVQILRAVEGKINLEIYQTTPLKNLFSGEMISTDEIDIVLTRIKPNFREDDLWTSINFVLNEVTFKGRASTTEANQEFFIFSDFPSTAAEDWRIASTQESLDGTGWRFFLISQPEIENNLSVQTAKVLTQIKFPGQLIDIITEVKNYSKNSYKDIPVQLFLDHKRVGQLVSGFKAKNSKEFLFRAYVKNSGTLQGLVEIPEDDYEADNRKFFQFSIPDQVFCTLIGPTLESLSFLEKALSSVNQDPHFIDYRVAIYDQASPLYLQNSDVIITINPSHLSQSNRKEIVKFLQRGGGMIAFFGDDVEKLNNYKFSNVFSLPRVNSLVELPDNIFHEVTFIDMDHPIFSDFPIANLESEMPQVFKHVSISPGDDWDILLTLSNGNPLLIEKHVGNGNVLVFSVRPNLRWTDLPIRGIFVPFLHRMIHYLSTKDGVKDVVIVGEKFEVPLDRSSISEEIEMISPFGQRTLLVPNYRREVVMINEVDEIGSYKLMAGSKEITSFVANVSENENPSFRFTTNKLISLFPEKQTRVVSWKEDIVSSVLEARRGTELWRPFVMAVLVVLVLETWVGRIRKESSEK